MIVILGAGGYVGRHLVADLVHKGYKDVCAVSHGLRYFAGVDYLHANLLDFSQCAQACEDATQIYHLAAIVGGIGYIEGHGAKCLTNSAISLNVARAAPPHATVLFASSSCVYPNSPFSTKEDYVRPQDLSGYALSKYFDERVFQAFHADFGLPIRIARLHTVTGPDDFRGEGRDHFVSALALKVARAKCSGVHEINIWGDGTQTRSLLYIDDAVEGLQRIMNGPVLEPLNLASNEVVSVNGVVDVLEKIAAIKLTRFYSPAASVGCQHKTADTSALRAAIGWEPTTPALTAIEATYRSAWDKVVRCE